MQAHTVIEWGQCVAWRGFYSAKKVRFVFCLLFIMIKLFGGCMYPVMFEYLSDQLALCQIVCGVAETQIQSQCLFSS